MRGCVAAWLLVWLLAEAQAQPEPVWTDNCVSVNANSGTCLQCVQGFYLEYFLCLPCAPLCQCASQFNYCDSCVELILNGTTHSLSPFLSLDLGRCFLCDQFLPYCLACNSTTSCSKCYGGRFPVATPEGAACLGECGSSCEICSNASSCLNCLPGYYLEGGSCSLQCAANCTDCLTSDACKDCFPGFYLNDTSGQCEDCNISDCLRCTNDSYCQNCAPGYYAVNGSCTSTGFPNCVVYIGGAEQASGCQICEPGYFVLYSNCFQCVGCALCSLQFLCQSPCFPNATPFNYACLEPQALLAQPALTLLALLALLLFL